MDHNPFGSVEQQALGRRMQAAKAGEAGLMQYVAERNRREQEQAERRRVIEAAHPWPAGSRVLLSSLPADQRHLIGQCGTVMDTGWWADTWSAKVAVDPLKPMPRQTRRGKLIYPRLGPCDRVAVAMWVPCAAIRLVPPPPHEAGEP